MKADIIIPVFNQWEYTEKCLRSIQRNTTVPYRFIVVDNGSTDGTAAYLSSWEDDDRLDVITNQSNRGFAKAVNQGIVAGRSPYVVLLNNDTEVPLGWLNMLIEAMEADPKIGALGALSTARTQSTFEALYMRTGVRTIRQYPLGGLPYSCVILWRTAIQDVGLLDEGFFLYGEDDDYNIRLMQAGWKIGLHTDLVIKHKHGATATPGGFQVHRKAAMKRLFQIWKGIRLRKRMRWLCYVLPKLFEPPARTVLYIGGCERRTIYAQALREAGHELTLLEIWPANCDYFRGKDLFEHVICGDVREVDKFLGKRYDVVFWWHGPEHVTNTELGPVLQKLEAVASHLVVLGCPWGVREQGPIDGNPYEAHVTHWGEVPFEELGYEVRTIGSRDGRGKLLAWKYMEGS